MRRMALFSMLAGMLLVPTMYGENVRRREVRQQKRIAQGVRSGQLTARETTQLERREGAFNRQIRRDRIDGGGLTARERAKAQRRQDELSRSIYRQKHDAQRRQP